MGSGRWSFIGWSGKELPSSFLVYERLNKTKKWVHIVEVYREFYNEESLLKTQTSYRGGETHFFHFSFEFVVWAWEC